MKTLIASLLVLLSTAALSHAGGLNDDSESGRKCKEEAARYFSELHGQGEKITDNGIISAGYSTHYNKTKNSCYLQRFVVKISTEGIITSTFKIVDEIHENALIGYCSTKPGDVTASSCIAGDVRCNTEQEFDKLIRPYMTL